MPGQISGTCESDAMIFHNDVQRNGFHHLNPY
jgi:hypothetical protein